MLDYPQINENQDRSNFINMVTALGYGRGNAGDMYASMKGVLNTYNIPLSIALASAIQETGLNAEGKCREEINKVFDKLIEVINDTLKDLTNQI